MNVSEMDERVKQMALKLYEEKAIKVSCERCFIVTDPKCPDFPHICVLEEGLKKSDKKEWIEENLSRCIEMRKAFCRR